jgi:hypothetical protein
VRAARAPRHGRRGLLLLTASATSCFGVQRLLEADSIAD